MLIPRAPVPKDMTIPEIIFKELSPKRGFPYPDWCLVYDTINQTTPEKERQILWEEVAKKWLGALGEQLGKQYELLESQNFYVLAELTGEFERSVLKTCEIFRSQILSSLEGIAKDEGYGKNVVIIFSNPDIYYEYVSHFFPDGEYSESQGMCIHSGYTHIVLTAPRKFHWIAPSPMELEDSYKNRVHTMHYKMTIVHELTHNFLSHLRMPKWLNEGLAMRVEELLLGTKFLHLDKELYEKHQSYWNSETIQKFWDGTVWDDSGEGFELSYSLAQILWNKIEKDLQAQKPEIQEFISNASSEDAGEETFRKIFDHSLGDLVSDFLGDSHCWQPKKAPESSIPSPANPANTANTDTRGSERRTIFSLLS
jgi:hypothetical protein